MTSLEMQTLILGFFPGLTAREASSTPAIKVGPESFFALMQKLKTDPQFNLDQLQLHTALDWLSENRSEDRSEDHLELLYLLNSTQHTAEVLVSVSLPRTAARINSVSSIWAIAEWQEREVYDMFGVLYENHPDLRRLLLDDDWQGFPLRKDYQDEFMLRKPW